MHNDPSITSLIGQLSGVGAFALVVIWVLVQELARRRNGNGKPSASTVEEQAVKSGQLATLIGTLNEGTGEMLHEMQNHSHWLERMTGTIEDGNAVLRQMAGEVHDLHRWQANGEIADAIRRMDRAVAQGTGKQ